MDAETPTTETPQEAEQPKSYAAMAAEMFGSQFTGEVPSEPETAPDPVEAEAPVEELQDEVVEVEAEAEAEVTEDSVEDETPISSLQELIEANEYDPDWFNGLKVPVKVNGESSEATLDEMVRSYQIQQAAEQRLEEAKLKAKSITNEAAEKAQQLEGQFAVAAQLIQGAEEFLDQSTKNIDWSALRAQDPAEYAARRADVGERRELIQKMKNDALNAYTQATQGQREEMTKSQQERLVAESEALVGAIPEWRDESTAATEKVQLSEFLISQGFTEDDVASASDHRLIVLARKAMLHDQLQAKTQTAKKKVVTVPKVLKPGTPKSPEQANNERIKEAKRRLRKSGSIDDAYALMKLKQGG